MPRKPVDQGLGVHNGRPIIAKQIVITKTGDGLSESMTVTPVDLKDGQELYVSLKVKHAKTRYDNVYSKDDPTELIGFNEVYHLVAQGAVFDDRIDAGEQIAAMELRLKQKAAEDAANAERAKREAKGEFELPFPAAEDEEL
jgi:hypothetical protein